MKCVGRMNKRVTLLDGGFSTQLVNYTGEVIDGDPLWTSRFLVTHKEKCVFTHRDYVKGSYEKPFSSYIYMYIS